MNKEIKENETKSKGCKKMRENRKQNERNEE